MSVYVIYALTGALRWGSVVFYLLPFG